MVLNIEANYTYAIESRQCRETQGNSQSKLTKWKRKKIKPKAKITRGIKMGIRNSLELFRFSSPESNTENKCLSL